MTSRKPLWLAFAVALSLTVPAAAHAEDGVAEAGPAKKKAVRKKARAKPKAAAPAKPAGPVPYTSLGPPVLPNAQPVTPGPPAHALTHDVMPQPAETNTPVAPPSDVAIAPKVDRTPPPPPPPPQVAQAIPPVAPTVNAPAQISLKCETRVMNGTQFVSQGAFYIDLFPSAVFPDQTADFKFLFVDPAHKSLVRGSVCLDTMCSANVTGSAYYLVNKVTKRGAALRITLDRSRGAFYAEEIDSGLLGMFGGNKKGSHPGESGFCTPQSLPSKLF